MAWTQRGSRVDRKFSVRRLDRVISERTLLAVRGAGEILGELAVLDSQPRTATVIAAEACQIRIIPAVPLSSRSLRSMSCWPHSCAMP
ncbi:MULTISPECIES: cyclic nucleotide-binding domain-containing protein [unclassified Streptomyces]|uniref:cyclic nucleotide-binding domain-containing protein n=1 Tax=unclassified Streptomyces TaxID=2593676 RepID=UPI002405E4C1|nr:cyclic nucleotide-binding domain-containing protein [Streptomyces sp. ADI95-17]WSX04556.1 cyclic nucleotide-binding domain-containing protein [Streptomyces sp. NBC_00987]